MPRRRICLGSVPLTMKPAIKTLSPVWTDPRVEMLRKAALTSMVTNAVFVLINPRESVTLSRAGYSPGAW